MPMHQVCRETKRGFEMSLGLWSHWSGAGGLGGGELGAAGPIVWAEPGVGTVSHLGVSVAFWGSWLGKGRAGEW